MAEARHSGAFGGAAPDALIALLHALATLHDEHGNVAVAGLRRAPWLGASYTDEEFRAVAGVEPGMPLFGTGGLGERLWSGPAITVVGIDAPAVDEAVNAVVPYARAKLNLRVHPEQGAAEAQEALIRHLEAVRPFGIALSASPAGAAGDGFAATTSGPAYEAAHAALRAAWGREPVHMAMGGAIPLASALHEAVPDAEILLFGPQDALCNLHAPNERVLLGELERAVVAEVEFLNGVRGSKGASTMSVAADHTTDHATPRRPSPSRRRRRPASRPEAEPRKFRFPSAFTVLLIVAVAVWVLAMIIPAGQYDMKDGSPVPGTYHEVPSPMDFRERVNDLLLSPVNGLYGIQDAETGVVSPGAVGELFGAAQVFLFVLAIGSFITVMFATGALDRGIARLAYRTRDRGWLMIVAIMSVFSLLGSVEGMAEETLGFYGLIVPLMLALGYDRMVAAAVILVGAGVGVIGSTVNPFSIGIASGFADTSIGDGIGLRFVMWIVLTGVAIAYVLRYARKVQADHSASLVGFRPGDREQAVAATAQEPPPLTTAAQDRPVGGRLHVRVHDLLDHPVGRHLRGPGRRPVLVGARLVVPGADGAVPRRRGAARHVRRPRREPPEHHDRQGRGRLHLPGARDRPGPRRDRDHDQRPDHRHRAARRWRTRPRARPRASSRSSSSW